MNKEISVRGVILETKRLTLRPFCKEDLHDFNDYAKVDGVGQMAGWPPHKSLEESEKILDLFLKEEKTFALVYEGKVIGSLGVEYYKEEEQPGLAPLLGREIGYTLAKEFWGRGLMAEAVCTVTEYLFEQEQLDFIVIGHFEWNKQSARVIEKCGLNYLNQTRRKTLLGSEETLINHICYRKECREKEVINYS